MGELSLEAFGIAARSQKEIETGIDQIPHLPVVVDPTGIMHQVALGTPPLLGKPRLVVPADKCQYFGSNVG